MKDISLWYWTSSGMKEATNGMSSNIHNCTFFVKAVDADTLIKDIRAQAKVEGAQDETVPT